MKRSLIKYISGLLLFGSNGIVASYVNINSYEIVFYRTALGSLFLLLIFLIDRKRFTAFRFKMQFIYLIISGIAMGASWIFLYEAYTDIGVSIASLLYYCGPVIVMVLSPIILKERLTKPIIIGFSAVLAGIIFINANSFGNKIFNSKGIIFALVSAVLYSVMIIFNKKAKYINGIENALLQLAAGFLTVAVFVGLRKGLSPAASGDVIPLLILGIINTGLGCYLYFSSLSALPVSTIAIIGYLEPLSAVVLSIVILGETMLPLQIIGAALILGGAFFGEFKSLRRNL